MKREGAVYFYLRYDAMSYLTPLFAIIICHYCHFEPADIAMPHYRH